MARGAKIPGLLLTAAVEQYILDRISRLHFNLDSMLAVEKFSGLCGAILLQFVRGRRHVQRLDLEAQTALATIVTVTVVGPAGSLERIVFGAR